MFVGVLTLAALAFIPVVLAEGNLHGLLQALNASGLHQFANATASLKSTPIGRRVLAQLSQGNKAIFAPTDNALSGARLADLNQTYLADIISYHIVSGNFINQTQTYPNVTIGRTLLNDSTLVTLEGNNSQVLVWSKSHNGSLFVENQGSNITVVNATSYNNTAILAIGSVLTPPHNISTILSNASYELTAIGAVLQSTTLPNGPSFLKALSSAHGVTVFAPNNAGVKAAASSLTGLSKNATALQDVLSNHIINGTSVYSTGISNKTILTSAAGQDYTCFYNSTGFFVSVGGSNAVQVVEADVLTSNGVIHIVNGVMLDTNSNAALASSAYASATSVAAHITQTGPIVSTPTPTQGGAVKGRANDWKLCVLAGMLTIGFGQCV